MKTDEFRLVLYAMFPAGNEYHVQRKHVFMSLMTYWNTISWLPMDMATCKRLIAEIRESEEVK